MYILPLLKRVDERLVIGHMREHPKLYLRVVRVNERKALIGNEHFSEFPAKLKPDGYVLQIRLGGAYSSRGRYGLVEGRVYPAVGFVYNREKAVRVCAFQLGDLSVIEYFINNGAVVSEAFQHLGSR